MRPHLRPLGVCQYESFHPELESQPSLRWKSGGFCEGALTGEGATGAYDATSLKPDETKAREAMRGFALWGLYRDRKARSAGSAREAETQDARIGEELNWTPFRRRSR